MRHIQGAREIGGQQCGSMPVFSMSTEMNIANGALLFRQRVESQVIIVVARGVRFDFVWSASYVGSLLYLAFFASVIGFGAYLTLVERIGADRAAYSGVLFPIVALGVSTFLENYQWTASAVIGVALVLAGNLLVLARRRAVAPLATSPLPAAGGSGN